MYKQYYSLALNPFSPNSDTRFFYLTPSHAESVAKCEYAIRNKSGLAVIYGDTGTGKTTIVGELKKRFGGKEYTVAILNNTKLLTSDTALLRQVADEFGLEPPRTKQATFNQLQEFLAQEVVEGRTPLLLIDEAHELNNAIRADRDMFGMVKTLTNIALEGERLVQVILFGELALIPMLKTRRSLMSRIAQFGVLSPLMKTDAVAMMEHRWKMAGGQLPLPFDQVALDVMYEAAKGLPRAIIKIANEALNHTYAERLERASRTSVDYAIQELHMGAPEHEEGDSSGEGGYVQ